MLLSNVIHVPGLNRRLISVRQWNLSGGNISFNIDHCIIKVRNNETGETFDYAVRPPYADTQSKLHTPNAVPAKKKRVTSRKHDGKT